jgi:crotonobetainyl-CoA:carnitine CoA-transferase CaiB-like acyl-CoA transferase
MRAQLVGMTSPTEEGASALRPLAARTFRVGSIDPASRIASLVLADLGATLVQAAPGATVDIGAGSSSRLVGLSPFGRSGRFRDAPPHHSAVEAIGGAQMAQYTYEPGPAYLVSPYSTVAQALLTAIAAIAGEIAPAAEPAHVSALQGLLAINEGFYVFGPTPEPDRFTHSPRGQTPVYSTYLAADDWIFLGASTTSFMIKSLQALGLDEVLDDPRVRESGARALRHPELARDLWERIGPVIAGRPRQHWLDLFESIKVPAGPVLSMEEALAHPQLQVAGLVEPDGPIGSLKGLTQVTRWNDATPRSPRVAGPRPLSGLRVVELAGYIAGSYTGRLLQDLGADVVKIEPPDGDPFRSNGYGFVAWNRGKRSLSLNLRDTADRARLLGLVAEADILVTNYRPEALTRMAVGREELFAVNGGLIHCTVSAFGESGPLAHLPGFDPVVQAFAGIMKRQGGDGEPVKPQMAATDYLSAMLAATGVLAARAQQLEQGGGHVVRTSLLAAALLLNAEAYDDARAGRRYATGGRDFKGRPPWNALFEARDGWLLTAASESHLASPDLVESAIGHAGVNTAIARLQALGVAAVPCIDPLQMPAEPHFVENRLWTEIDQPELGLLTLPAPVLGPALADPAPLCGEHNGLAVIWRTA